MIYQLTLSGLSHWEPPFELAITLNTSIYTYQLIQQEETNIESSFFFFFNLILQLTVQFREASPVKVFGQNCRLSWTLWMFNKLNHYLIVHLNFHFLIMKKAWSSKHPHVIPKKLNRGKEETKKIKGRYIWGTTLIFTIIFLKIHIADHISTI